MNSGRGFAILTPRCSSWKGDIMTDTKRWMRLGAAVGVAALLGCAKGEQASQSADSTARNLTLAPTESTAAMKDVPARSTEAAKTAPEKKQPVKKPAPPKPAPLMLSAGTRVPL